MKNQPDNSHHNLFRELADDLDVFVEQAYQALEDPKLQSKLKGQVLWVDEAGLMGTRTMAQVFELAKQHDTRLILSGDDKQHGAVERGGPNRPGIPSHGGNEWGS